LRPDSVATLVATESSLDSLTSRAVSWRSGLAAFARVADIHFVSAILILLLAAASVPIVVGYLLQPPGKWFSGIAGNVHDTAQYLSWMRESADRLFIENKLTSEPNPAVFLNLHWWIPGRLAALMQVDLPTIYQLFRIVAVAFYVGVAHWFCGIFFVRRAERRFALAVATFSSGAGWIWVLDKYISNKSDVAYPMDVYAINANTVQMATIAPHALFALALMLLVLGLAWVGFEQNRLRLTAISGALALLLGLGHIYDLVTVWAVLGTFGLFLWWRDRSPAKPLLYLGLIPLLSAPAPAYFGWVSSDVNPTWRAALAQYDNLNVHTPDALHLLVLLGPLFVVALAGVVWQIRQRRPWPDRVLFLVGWFVANLLIIYLPIRFEIMLLTGFQVVSAILATETIFHWIPRLGRQARVWGGRLATRRMRIVLPFVFFLAVLPTNVYLLGWRINYLSQGTYPFFLNSSDVDALSWLEANTSPDDVVLSSFFIGHFLPGLSGNKAFLSNAVMTLDFFQKRDAVDQFFASNTSDQWRADLLRKSGVDYVFYGPAERAVGEYDPRKSPLFAEVFSDQGTSIVRFAGPAARSAAD
jgi:hypothetical protein